MHETVLKHAAVKFGAVILLAAATPSIAQETEKKAARPAAPPADGSQLLPLNEQKTVLIDLPGKRLVVKAEVSLREGLLEMLACLKGTKEHEAILRVDTKAQTVHAGLLALGAQVGTPVQFTPEYKPATGTKIKIMLQWVDADGRLQRVPARQWVRHATQRYFVHKLEALPAGLVIPDDSELRYDEKHEELLWYGPMTVAERERHLALSQDKNYRQAIRAFFKQSQFREMEANWVFAGSGFHEDPQTGREYYLAESGDLICVANFATATLDLAIKSSAENQSLAFEAYTERIPPLGTPVTIELLPELKSQAK